MLLLLSIWGFADGLCRQSASSQVVVPAMRRCQTPIRTSLVEFITFTFTLTASYVLSATKLPYGIMPCRFLEAVLDADKVVPVTTVPPVVQTW